MVKRRGGKPAGPRTGPAYAPAVKAGAQALTTRVQQMHTAISDKTFQALQRVPGLAAPARLVQGAHDLITGGVYAAVRGGTGAAMRLAGEAERVWKARHPAETGEPAGVRSALNAAAGDALAQAASPLALAMTLHADTVVLDDAAPPAAWAGLDERVVVFVHGLACDERSWRLFDAAWDGSRWAEGQGRHYGELLRRELAMSPLYLRYNTGLALGDNARGLSQQLTRLADRAPQVREIVLVGHSMGGLVARAACEQAGPSERWRVQVRRVVCLGSPHRGAPLEKLGAFVALALGVSDVTQPLQALADARSQGIKDLRHGLAAPAPGAPQAALRLVAGKLDAAPPSTRRPLRKVLSHGLGDGLVTTTSALDSRLVGDVERVELPGLGHMALLNHPRVYELLRDWLDDVPAG